MVFFLLRLALWQMPELGRGLGGEGQTSTLVLLCVDSPLLCFINSGSFYPFVFLFVFIKFIKVNFLDSLKVKIMFLHVSLAPGACRLHLTRGKFSRWLKTVRIGRERGTEILKCHVFIKSGPFSTLVLLCDPFFTL